VTAALDQASERLSGSKPDLGLVFASASMPLDEVLATARARVPGVDFVACTTAGEFTERGLTNGGVAVMLIAWADAAHRASVRSGPDADAATLVEQLCGEWLRDESESRFAACLLLGDGLSPLFEKLVEQVSRKPARQPVIGAGAADGRNFRTTSVGVNDVSGPGAMAAIHMQGARRWGVGVAHGLHPVTQRMTVTRAAGNIVTEIDERPALEVYREFAQSRGLAFDEGDPAQFLVENELGVLLFQDIVRIRAPIRIVRDDELYFAGEVPEGSSVCIVRGEREEILTAARTAAEEAQAELGDARAAGVLVFSCVCRAMVLGTRYGEEIDAVRAVFPDVPIVGFSSYGEVARTRNKLDGYHNNTIVVAAIPE
jgi:hypothetical protein